MKPYLIIRTINQKLSLQESFKIVLIARVIGKAVTFQSLVTAYIY